MQSAGAAIAAAETMPLVCAAARLTALSKASGPSSTPPVIWPRSAILQSAAASSVEGSLSVTVSTAERIATFGVLMPMVRASSMAFWQMSRVSVSDGRMLIAAPVMRSGRG